jgi:hypothetical protein
MEQEDDFTPRWFEPEEWDGQDSSLPEEPWVPDEIDRLIHPELNDYQPVRPPARVPGEEESDSAHPERESSGAGTPRRRTPRRDGFTPDRQEDFVELVRGGASGREASRRIGISPTTAYNLYNSPEGAAFRAAWDEAAKVTDIVLDDTAFDRAVNGQEEIVYHQGRRVGVRWKYDNKLLMQLLRARNPLKYAPLSEIEGWLKHRGIALPPDVDAALARLRPAEAELRLPAEAPALLPSGERADPAAQPRKGEGVNAEEAPVPSTSSTSPESSQADAPAHPSTSSTSSENGQEPPAQANPAAPSEAAPVDPAVTIYRPPPVGRVILS